jgi:hypothetical protein
MQDYFIPTGGGGPLSVSSPLPWQNGEIWCY